MQQQRYLSIYRPVCLSVCHTHTHIHTHTPSHSLTLFLLSLPSLSMALACQRDSYAQTLTTAVLSCTQASPGQYDVVLADTVLFPEGKSAPVLSCPTLFSNLELFALNVAVILRLGGGQPDDHGTIARKRVISVQRQQHLGEPVHRILSDTALKVCLRWDAIRE